MNIFRLADVELIAKLVIDTKTNTAKKSAPYRSAAQRKKQAREPLARRGVPDLEILQSEQTI